MLGRYYSAEWVRRNILQQTKEEITQIDQQIKQEEENGTGGWMRYIHCHP